MLIKTKHTKPLFDKFTAITERHEMAKMLGQARLAFNLMILSPTHARFQGRDILLVGTNSYLGLTFNPNVKKAMVDAIDRYGSGTTGSRQANGTYSEHTQLETELKDFFDMPALLSLRRATRQIWARSARSWVVMTTFLSMRTVMPVFMMRAV